MLTINKSSWHYRLASYYNSHQIRHIYNICQYARHVLVGFLALCAMTTIIGALALANIFGIVAAFQGVWLYHNGLPTFLAGVNIGTVGGALLLFVIIWGGR